MPIVALALIVGAVVLGFSHVRSLDHDVIDRPARFRKPARPSHQAAAIGIATGGGTAAVSETQHTMLQLRAGSQRAAAAMVSLAIRRDTVSAAQAMRTSDTSMEGGIAVAKRAGDALGGVQRAIGTTSSVADELAERAREMRAASLRVTESVASASAAVEENAAAAAQMRATTHEVTSSILLDDAPAARPPAFVVASQLGQRGAETSNAPRAMSRRAASAGAEAA